MKQYAKLTPLVKNPAALKTARDLDADEAMRTLARRLSQVGMEGSFDVYVLDGGKGSAYRLGLAGGRAAPVRQVTGRPTFAIRASRETLAAVAKGELSPVDAYLLGKMEVHGDLEFGKRLYAALSAKGAQTEL
jgi:putative sterol carrier protein